MKTSAIILDRDGVINVETNNFVRSPQQWRAIPGSLQAIADLTKAGIKLFVATNQSGIARGYYTLDTLNRIHEKMLGQITDHGGAIEQIYFCPHVDQDNCDCRKPKPGMLKSIANEHGIDLNQAIMIGDSIRDLQAAMAVNVAPVYLSDELNSRKIINDRFPDQGEKIKIFKDLSSFTHEFLVYKT